MSDIIHLLNKIDKKIVFKNLPINYPVSPTDKSFAKSKRPKTLSGLDSVAGMHELKRILREDVVAPVREPEKYRSYGLTVPNGILLYGPPGCGKTYIAERLARELGWNFKSVIASDVGSPFIHDTGTNIAKVFQDAELEGPTVLFIDEIEGIGGSRKDPFAKQYKVEEVNVLLAQLNNAANRGILVVMATNEPKLIDEAIYRSGRTDKVIYVGPPDLESRGELLKFHLKGRVFGEKEIDFKKLAKKMSGFSCSDIKLLVDEAARRALRANEPISQKHFEAAISTIPPSVPSEKEADYKDFFTRGTGNDTGSSGTDRTEFGFHALLAMRQNPKPD